MSEFTPSSELIRFRDYARRMVDDPTQTDAESKLWEQLADEIDQYAATSATQDSLFA